MKKDLQYIKNLLLKEGYTVVLSDGEEVVKSTERGVLPLVKFIESGKDYRGYFAADKVVGKAAALLYAHMGVSSLYAGVVSAGAKKMCEKYGINLEYGVLTDAIINRKGDGFCPMEQAVSEIDEPIRALEAVKKKIFK